MEPLPRAVIWVARGHMLLVLLGLVVGVAAALAMRGVADPQAHARMFALHGAVMSWLVVMPAVFGVLANLVVPETLRAKAIPTIRLAALGLVLWSTGAIVLASIGATSDGWTLYTPQARSSAWVPPALVAMGLLLTLVHLASVLFTDVRSATPLAIVVVLGILGPLGWQCYGLVNAIVGYFRDPLLPIEHSLGFFFEDSMHMNVLATLAIVTHMCSRALGPSEVWPRRAAAGLVGVTLWYVVKSHWVTSSIGLGAIVTIVVVWLVATVRSRGAGDPLTLGIATAVAPAMIVFGFARWVLARVETDIHLHDTLFVVGTFHAGGAIVALGFFGGMIVWSTPLLGRAPRMWPARIGMVLFGTGSVALSIVMLLLGSAGMPRRYATWPAELDALQDLTTFAGYVVATGAALVLVAVTGRRRDDGRTISDR